jgi:aminopeptidase N
MLNYNTWPEDLRSIFPYYIKTENQKANIKLLLGYYKKLFWRYSLPGERDSIAPVMEKLLWTKANQTDDEVLKREFFETYLNTAITPQSIKKLVDIWNEKTSVKGLKLKGDDYTEIACELAVRKETPAGKFIPDNILKQQLERINGKQKKNDFAFLMPALNKNPGVRAEFFETLKLPASRGNMPLVLKALHYLNHPLVALHSESFILPAMEMLEEIKEINGMVYVKTWLDETFYGHNSKQVAKLIDEYLNKKHDLDAVLRTEILQASDPVLRASKILNPEN